MTFNQVEDGLEKIEDDLKKGLKNFANDLEMVLKKVSDAYGLVDC